MLARLQNTRQPICSDWKTLENQPANLHTHSGLEWILSKHFFFLQEEGFQVRTALSLFTVNALRLRQLPSVDMSMPNRHAQLRIGPIVRREARKKHRYQKRLSEKLTYFLATPLDIRTSSYALNHIQTITMVYAIRGPAGTLTQATIYYFVWKGSFFVMF